MPAPFEGGQCGEDVKNRWMEVRATSAPRLRRFESACPRGHCVMRAENSRSDSSATKHLAATIAASLLLSCQGAADNASPHRRAEPSAHLTTGLFYQRGAPRSMVSDSPLTTKRCSTKPLLRHHDVSTGISSSAEHSFSDATQAPKAAVAAAATTTHLSATPHQVSSRWRRAGNDCGAQDDAERVPLASLR